MLIGRVLACGVIALSCPLAAGGQDASAPPAGLRYELTDLGTLGGDHVAALAMNDDGVIVGWSQTGPPLNEIHAFVWVDGVMTDLGTLGGDWSQAVGVNNQGRIIGVTQDPSGQTCAFYAFDGRVRDLNEVLQWPPHVSDEIAVISEPIRRHPPSSAPDAGYQADIPDASRCDRLVLSLPEVTAINESGQIVGCGMVTGHDYPHGLLLTPLSDDPRMMHYDYVDLGELPGAQGCLPYDVNDLDVVVGVSGNRAFIWVDGVIEPLDLITRTVLFESRAVAINNLSLAAGWFAESDPAPHHACLWQNGFRFDLPVDGGVGSEALDLNDAAQVVGWAFIEGGPVAALWEGGVFTDLNEVTAVPLRAPGGGQFMWQRLEEGIAIDGMGRIAGTGRGADGRTRAFLLTPLSQDD